MLLVHFKSELYETLQAGACLPTAQLAHSSLHRLELWRTGGHTHCGAPSTSHDLTHSHASLNTSAHSVRSHHSSIARCIPGAPLFVYESRLVVLLGDPMDNAARLQWRRKVMPRLNSDLALRRVS